MSKKNKSRKKKIVNIVSIIIFILLLLITIGVIGVVISLGIMPLKYLIIILIVLGLMYLGFGKIVFNKKIRIWVKILISVITSILIIGYLFGFYYLNSTLNFMDKIKADEYQLEKYYILTKKDSDIKQIEDIKTLGVYGNNENTKKALSELKREIKYTKKEYDNYIDLANSILNSKVDAILLSASYKDIVSEMIEDFQTSIEIIYTIEIKTKSGIKVNEVDIASEPFNVYISGIDIYGEISMVSRSDVNMIMSVNPKTHEILLTSIPRDYYVQLHGTTGSKDKLTHAGLYGINMSIETIEDLLDEKIDYYVRVNFTTLISLVDAIGGIEVYSDTAFRAWTDESCYYNVGNITLDGKCALAYARERMAYIDGDRHRVQNQQDVISAIMNKTLSSRTLITKYTNILESMSDSFQTNIPTKSIYELINMQLDKMPSWNFSRYSLNGYDSTNGTYTFGAEQLYVMEPDMSTVEEARNKIDETMKK